ncbi:hypothetical protein GCM10027615_37430 [Plantactinospora veratri]
MGLAVFYLWPVLQTAYFSFSEWGPFGGHEWIGLENYRTLVGDAEALRALGNTTLYTVLGLAGIPVAIVFAALLNRRRLRAVSVYRMLFFLPMVTMPVAIAMVWRWLYNGEYGLVNHVLSLVGIDGPHWIADPATALYALAAVGIWTTLGYNLVIFLAGMQAIPRSCTRPLRSTVRGRSSSSAGSRCRCCRPPSSSSRCCRSSARCNCSTWCT